MENIVRTWEEIELTEAELELTDAELEGIYGAGATDGSPLNTAGTCFSIPVHIEARLVLGTIFCGTCDEDFS